jgi:serine/threonine protein kinase
MESGSVFLGTSGGGASRGPRLERYGRYFLVERIAVGGMAEVYRAVTHGVEGFRRTFVVKRILAEKATNPTFVRMFCDEARISALLHHPNIVQVYDFGHVNGSYFLAMEYLPGKDLSSLMRVLRAAKASVPPCLAAYVAREVAAGLHYAHTLRAPSGQPLGIVHRDVTPSNIMLLYAGGVKVLDFGIAKASSAVQAAETEGVKGKFGYLSPEQARSADVDGRSDIFGLGVTLWEMLAGRRLFASKNEIETLRNVLQKPVPPPSAFRPEIPAELDRIVLRALERSPDRRYASAEEMARDCEEVVRDARADGQALRAFLNDLFAEESSSLSLEGPELPEELFRDGSGPIPLVSSLSGSGDSLEIEVIEPSVPTGRGRNPAPPFGVMASDDTAAAPASRSSPAARRALAACAVAVVAAALAVASLHVQARHARDVAAAEAAPAPSALAPSVIATPSPAMASPPTPAAPPGPAATPSLEAAKAEEHVHRSHRSSRGARVRAMSSDLTLDPF